MSAIAIHAWLQGKRNYSEGLALLRAHGEADDTDLWFLGLGETSVSKDQLAAALGELHARQVRETLITPERAGQNLVLQADVVASSTPQGRNVESDGYVALSTRMPPQLKAVHDDVRVWAREMNYLRYPERMEKLATDAERLRDGLRVIELDQMIVMAYARLDAWRDTGRDPGESRGPAPSIKNGAKLAQELKNIESYMSRAGSGARPASPEKKLQWQKRKDEIKALIDAVPA